MKSSRAMLLAALMFAVPAFAEDTTPATTTPTEVTIPENDTKVAPVATPAQPSWLAAKVAVLTGAASQVINWPVNHITTPILTRIPGLNRIEMYNRNVPTIGKVAVTAALVYAAIKAYEAYVDAQDADTNDDEEIFGE
jgi:hypothetical protein